MRVPLSAALFAVLLSLPIASNTLLVPAAEAQETVRFKSRKDPPTPPAQKPTVQQPPAQKPAVYKPPVQQPPAQPPATKEHPYKRPPDPRPQDPPTPPPPSHQPPPIVRGWPSDPPCPPPPFPIPAPLPEPYPGICPPLPGELGPIHDGRVIEPIANDLNSVLSRRLHLLQVEGFVGQVAVGWDGHVQFERSYGAGRFYDIGPVTEAFTAEAVYKLVEEKRLSLTTTLGELFSVVPPDKHGITIEQLLAQTSGLGNTYAADRETDRDAAVAKLLAQPLAHAPGELFTPSDDGYVILAAVIDVASGVPYETYLLQSGVVAKDMTSTVFWGDWGSRHTYWGKRGSDGILSTAHDLCLWASRFVDQSDYAMNEIVRPRVWTEDGLGIGYGWFMDNTDAPLLWTNGVGESDHNVMVVVYPSNVVLAVSSDRIKGDATWSELVANALEPVLREFVPPSHDGQIRPLAVSEAERH